ncbi:MAG: hypothetical protein ACHREM_20425, partial [Polyangiales bacterium]
MSKRISHSTVRAVVCLAVVAALSFASVACAPSACAVGDKIQVTGRVLSASGAPVSTVASVCVESEFCVQGSLMGCDPPYDSHDCAPLNSGSDGTFTTIITLGQGDIETNDTMKGPTTWRMEGADGEFGYGPLLATGSN